MATPMGWRNDSRVFKPYVRRVDYLTQLYVLATSGDRVHRQDHLARRYKGCDLKRWFDEMFGLHTRPTEGVWYPVPAELRERRTEGVYYPPPLDAEVAAGTASEPRTVWFDAFGYAEALCEELYLDPRRQRFFPSDLPNIEEFRARRGGERCEICLCDWDETCQPESPLLHEWKTACVHWACRSCWLSLGKNRCPWCAFDVYDFLNEINASRVAPAAQRPTVTCIWTGGPEDEWGLLGVVCGLHVGWIYETDEQDLLNAGFEIVVDSFNDEMPACRLNDLPVALYNPFRKPNDTIRTWLLICQEDFADDVLAGCACLFPRVTKSRTFAVDTFWSGPPSPRAS